MTQMTFQRDALGHVGTTYNTREPKSDTKTANGTIEFGRKLSYDNVHKKIVSTIATNKVDLKLSGDIDTSDTVGFTLKVTDKTTGNESVHTPSVTFVSSESNTLGTVLVATLEGYTGINAVGTSYDATNNILSIKAEDGYCIEVSNVAFGGGSTVTLTSQTNSDTRISAGFALNPSNVEMYQNTAGDFVSNYRKNDIVSMFTGDNELIIESTTGFNATDTLYYVGYGVDAGKIANAAGNNGILATNIKHYISAKEDGKGVITVRDN